MTDTVRASREGHHFHEAWTARRALELIAPVDDLVGIAVEGLAPADFSVANQETIEIADLSLYYGETTCTFDTCSRHHVLQFKYSISSAHTAAAASDMAKTLRKFAASDKALLKQHRDTPAMQKRRYGIVTNRPISDMFMTAIKHVRENTIPEPMEKALLIQYNAFCAAVDLDPTDRADFAQRLDFHTDEENVKALERGVRKQLASWSAGSDIMATARLHRLCTMVREKAESPGEQRNVIRRVDVLDALGLADEDELLPTPCAFPPVDTQIMRSQTRQILELIPSLTAPLILHAPGGTGKTVLMQSLYASAPSNFEIVLFDCFAGGAYRALEDARHRLDRGLLHIVNQLAAKGLCDPLLPCQGDASALLSTFRKRLTQAVETLRVNQAAEFLVLLIDAADNAAQQALDRGEDAFPVALIETAVRLELPAHVRLVLSCRTERQTILVKNQRLPQFAVQGFTRAETAEYVRASIGSISEIEIDIAVARSVGNPRVLSHLIDNWDELIRGPESLKILAVEDLISQRVHTAIRDAADRDGGMDYLKPLLAGLAVLPPPIPLAEYADANGIVIAHAQSMFADLNALLEMTSLGVIFRDESTEAFIRTNYGDDLQSLHALAKRLDLAQEKSQYACYALPGLLKQLGDMEAAIDLAYSERLPLQQMSDVGKRALRILRIKTALGLAVRSASPPTVAGLLVELGTLLHGSSKGDRFIAANPDLVALTDDIDAMRRLFELQTYRPESRHARLAIVHILKGDLAEAAKYAKRVADWSTWRKQKNKPNEASQDHIVDLVALPLDHIARGEFEAAFALIADLSQETGFATASRVFALARELPDVNQLAMAYNALCSSPVAAPSLFGAALTSWPDRDAASEATLVTQLARSLKEVVWTTELSAIGALHRAILDGAAAALRLGLKTVCDTLLAACKLQRPDVRAFAGNAHGLDLAPWVFYTIIEVMRQGRTPSLHDLLPTQMYALTDNQGATPEIVAALITQHTHSNHNSSEVEDLPESMSTTLFETILPMMDVVLACTQLISNCGDATSAQNLFAAWECLPRQDEEGKRIQNSARHLDTIGRDITLRTLRICHQFSPELAARCFQLGDRDCSWMISEQIAHVARCAHIPATHPVAYALMERVTQRIANQPHMSWRSEAYAELARAILPASPDDARALCRRSLSLIDEIVATDTTILSQVFAIMANLKNMRLTPVQAYRFIRLCESCFSGSYVAHFPWYSFGQAAAMALGESSLILLGQWEQEGLVDLDSTLSPVITALLERNILDAAPALALFMLDMPKQWYAIMGESTPGILENLDGGTASALIERNDMNASQLLDALLRQSGAVEDSGHFPIFLLHEFLKHSKNSKLLSEAGLTQLRTVLTANSAWYGATSDVGKTPIADNEAANARLEVGVDVELAFAKEIAATTDIVDADAIAMAWSKFEASGCPGSGQSLFDELQSQVEYSQRRRYLEALASVRLPFDGAVARLAALEECLKMWSNTISVQELRPLLASRLVGADPASLVRDPYGFDMVLQRLAKLGPTPVDAVAKDVIACVSLHELDAAPTMWLTLAALLTTEVDAKDAPSIGQRLFESGMARLAAKGGQLENTGWPEQPIDAAEGVAGLIWNRLGDAHANHRARATGAVAFLAEHGRWSELDHLVARWDTRDAGLFGSPAHRFCYLDARCSLATGLALAALRYPETMSRYQETFWRLLRANPSHPLLRATVLKGLEVLGADETLVPLADTTADLKELVASKGIPGFVFGNKESEFRELTEIFELEATIVANLVASKIVEWDPEVKHALDDELIDRFDNYREYMIASSQQQYVAHLCWHASLTIGCELTALYDAKQRVYDRARWDRLIVQYALLPQA
ncbi:hypothetical protein ACO0LG_04690 [Undibacterium sp. Ji42W]|uniref:hypothetical protein n=1 Tax=Undibacterium sp. Ji42W TaxID=3413039 RepID=UPI003BF1274B